MKTISNQVLLAASAGILIVGLAWASQIYASSPRGGNGPDPATLRRLAETVQQHQVGTPIGEPAVVALPAPAVRTEVTPAVKRPTQGIGRQRTVAAGTPAPAAK